MVSKEIAEVGMWGTKGKGSVRNEWSFKLEKDHKLKTITIGYNDCISSLMFTSEDSMGHLHTSNKIGDWKRESLIVQAVLEPNEKIISISGTTGSPSMSYSYKVIYSLSFVTTKRKHGPYGPEKGTHFFVPWDEGSFAGFYGLAGKSIFGIGVYLKASDEIARVGMWGKSKGDPKQQWSFLLRNNHKMHKIYITHTTEFIYNLKFLGEHNGYFQTSNRIGGSKKGAKETQVTFDSQEEFVGIEGTFQDLTGSCAGYTVASSLSFITTKKTYGPFGQVKGTSFSVPWKVGQFAGFYGLADCSIFGIGVYLKATI